MTFAIKLVVITKEVVCKNQSHAMDEIIFHQIHVWPPYSVYMSDLATKIIIIWMTSCILPRDTHLDLRHMAPI